MAKMRSAFGVEFTAQELAMASGYAMKSIQNYIYRQGGYMEAVCKMVGIEDGDTLRYALESVRGQKDDEAEAAVEAIMDIIGVEDDGDTAEEKCDAIPSFGSDRNANAAETVPEADETIQETETDRRIALLHAFRDAALSLRILQNAAINAERYALDVEAIERMRGDLDELVEIEYSDYIVIDYEEVERRMRAAR